MKINLQTIIFLILILVIGYGFYSHFQQKMLNSNRQEKLIEALEDIINVRINERGELEHEKLTLQEKIKELSGDNYHLSESQNKLLEEVKRINKDKEVIAAAYINLKVQIDSIRDHKPVLIDSSSVTFSRESDSIKYNIRVDNVVPSDSTFLLVNRLVIPNYQTINFSWGDKKEGYPVSFSITNSNPLIKVTEMDSYIIPEIIKSEVKPNFWQKISQKSGGK